MFSKSCILASFSLTHFPSLPSPPLPSPFPPFPSPSPVSEEAIELVGGKTYSVTASFTNPLKKPLSNVIFHIEGARLSKAQKIKGK